MEKKKKKRRKKKKEKREKKKKKKSAKRREGHNGPTTEVEGREIDIEMEIEVHAEKERASRARARVETPSMPFAEDEAKSLTVKQLKAELKNWGGAQRRSARRILWRYSAVEGQRRESGMKPAELIV